MQVIFVLLHGWGFQSSFWNPLSDALRVFFPDAIFETPDLGYFTQEQTHEPFDQYAQNRLTSTFFKITKQTTLLPPVVMIGHSQGMALLATKLKKKSPDPRTPPPSAFIGFNGFCRFSRCTEDKILQQMSAGIEKKASTQLMHFYRLCGVPRLHLETFINTHLLLAGLENLAKTDITHHIQTLTCPVLMLSSKNDRIVPAHISHSDWSNYEHLWHDKAGHALPLTNPEWSAKQIFQWLQARL